MRLNNNSKIVSDDDIIMSDGSSTLSDKLSSITNDVKPLELEPPMCEGETKREKKDNNEINQCLKEILNTCNSEDEEVDDKI